jgi:hypothetical protein
MSDDALHRTFRPSPDVLARSVGDELVLLDLASEQYFSLDPVGAAMWEVVVEAPTLIEARDALLEDWEVPAEELAADLLELCQDLQGRGLLVEEPAP